jgi:bifunctional DNA-binding transcriptional regulator/antitoxin component of YhaV-PrlF toxin-antitoxin module
MDKDTAVSNTGHVGRRGAIVLPAASRRRYGLADGSLFISEEREDGILIRRAKAVPSELDDVRQEIRVGLDQLKRGEGLDGEKVFAEMKQMSTAFRAKKKK